MDVNFVPPAEEYDLCETGIPGTCGDILGGPPGRKKRKKREIVGFRKGAGPPPSEPQVDPPVDHRVKKWNTPHF